MEVGKIVQLNNTPRRTTQYFVPGDEFYFKIVSWVAMVREFHEKYSISISTLPQDVDDDIFELRRGLIDEEYNELDRAMSHSPFNPANIADAIADLIYVLIGTALSYGIPLDEVFAEVHRSNMTKDGPRRADGKILKGESFEPPKIKEILDRHVQTTPGAPA